MKRSAIVLAATALIAALIPSGPLFASPVFSEESGGEEPDALVAAQMSLGDAKDLIQKWFRWGYGEGAPDGVPGAIEFTPAQIVLVWYVSPPQVRHICPYETSDPFVSSKMDVVAHGAHQTDTVFNVGSDRRDGNGCAAIGIHVATHDQAMQVAAALLRWKNATAAERQGFFAAKQAVFAPVVAAYLASNPRPQISEDVHRYAVMADAAVQSKRFADAVDNYESGLKLAPWWPEGQFNEALILSQMHYYDEAVEHMKNYIALAPGATNARVAQDKIYVWEGERQAVSQ